MPLHSKVVLLGLLLAQTVRATAADESPIRSITVKPATIVLRGSEGLRGVLVSGHRQDGRIVDLTHRAAYRSTAPRIFAITAAGVATAVGDGRGTLEVTFKDHTARIPVQVEKSRHVRRPDFSIDVIPVLSKYGCNSSGCHGKAEGQNGFKLSVFGFDPLADYDALTKEARGRRAFPAAPHQSLVLTKISGEVPHGGGIRLRRGSREYNTLHNWIATGAAPPAPQAAKLERIEVSPRQRIMDIGGTQQLRVTAYYQDGRLVDVTQIAKFQSNHDGLAVVDGSGRIQVGTSPGQVAIMASFTGAVDTAQILIPRPGKIDPYPALPEENFIDQLVHQKLRQLNIVPSETCGDAEFMRRVYLDLIGTMPTPSETRRFLENASDSKRSRLVDELLARPEYADYWALKWSDLLRVDQRALGHERARAYHSWIRKSLADNKPLDRFVREILTLQGNLKDAPQSGFYAAVSGAGERANTVSQVFLGIRIACAQCHHHPFDRWSQTDYYGMAAFFQQLKQKKTARGAFLTASGDPVTKHPRSGERVFAHALGTAMPDKSPDGDRRRVLADWMTSPANGLFARNAANRIWAHLLGRGIVEPVDDIRDTNPPTNPELLEALAQHLIKSGFDTRSLIRTITASRTYQRSSRPNPTNTGDEQNYSRALLKRMDAEVLFDAISQVTGIPEKFRGVPLGARAIQLWDSEVDHYFLKLFGRPTRKTACQCERNAEPTVSQVLHVLNSPEIHDKLAHDGGRVARIVRQHDSDEQVVEELYLAFFARMPTSDESLTAVKYFKQSQNGRRGAAEDLAWSLLNSLEFIFNH